MAVVEHMWCVCVLGAGEQEMRSEVGKTDESKPCE